ncbi:MAG: DsrE family protein [Thermoplasmata archaeon]|nr:DsrE family protein [Thermoplasmata archaeon]
MATGAISRTLAVAEATIVGTLQGSAWLGLAGAALVYPLLVGAIAAAGFSGLDLLAAAETLFSTLFLPVVLLLVCLVQGVSLFRTELEEDTLLYPLKRTVPRPALVVGKYLGFLASTLLALIPSAVFGTALAAVLGDGPTYATAGLLEAVVLLTIEGVRLATKGYADDIEEPGFPPLREVLASFVANRGQIWACGTCAKPRGITEADLIEGARIVTAANVIEYMAGGAATLSF